MRTVVALALTLVLTQFSAASAQNVPKKGTASGTTTIHHHVQKQSYQTGFSVKQSSSNAMLSPGTTPSGWVTKSTELTGTGSSMHSAHTGFSPPAPKAKPAEIKPVIEIKPVTEIKIPEQQIIPTPKIQEYQ